MTKSSSSKSCAPRTSTRTVSCTLTTSSRTTSWTSTSAPVWLNKVRVASLCMNDESVRGNVASFVAVANAAPSRSLRSLRLRRQSLLFRRPSLALGQWRTRPSASGRSSASLTPPPSLGDPNLPHTEAGRKIEASSRRTWARRAAARARVLSGCSKAEAREKGKEGDGGRLWAYENHSGRSATSLVYKLPPEVRMILTSPWP